MGYTTIFTGDFKLDRPIPDNLFNYHKQFSRMRHTAKNNEKLEEMGYGPAEHFGYEGEYAIANDSPSITIDSNRPPASQPGLWCHWIPGEDQQSILWDGVEKFYEATNWLAYLISHFYAPRGFIINGIVNAQGEGSDDQYHIVVENNVIQCFPGFHNDVEIPDFDRYY
jgi:hypothetical protein